MVIRFVCCCGKRLRAREDMAGRRSMCPACGAPVGIPRPEPTHHGVPADVPQQALEMASRGSNRPDAGSEWRKAGTPMPSHPAGETYALAGATSEHSPALPGRNSTSGGRLTFIPERRRATWRQPRVRRLETRWYQCLGYSLCASSAIVRLAGGLAAMSGIALVVTPYALEHACGLWPLVVLIAVLLALVAGHASRFFSQVLAYAAAGQVKHVVWRDLELDPWAAWKSLGIWIGCFLAGPVLPAVGGLLYWVHCGTIALLDWLILAELGILAIGYWMIALLVLSRAERLLDANPVRVIEAMACLGSRCAAASLVGFCFLLAHGWLGIIAAAQLHRNPARGSLLLGLLWISALYLGTFGFRLVGLWYFRASRQVWRDIPIWAQPGKSFAPPVSVPHPASCYGHVSATAPQS